MTPSGSAKPERVANLKACHLLLNKSIEKKNTLEIEQKKYTY